MTERRPAPATFRQRFVAGEHLLGTFIKTPTSHAIEILGSLGYDFVVIDEEHAPFDRVAIDVALLAARALGGRADCRGRALGGEAGLRDGERCGGCKRDAGTRRERLHRFLGSGLHAPGGEQSARRLRCPGAGAQRPAGRGLNHYAHKKRSDPMYDVSDPRAALASSAKPAAPPPAEFASAEYAWSYENE